MRGFIGIVGILIIGVILFFSLNWIIGGCFDAIEEERAEGAVLVGEEVVINNDTLVIVDYKVFGEKYVLSSGVEISEEYANKLTGGE